MFGRVGERFEALAIRRSHPPQMARVVSTADEVGERHLFEERRMQIGSLTSGQELVVKIGGHDHETETQCGKNRLRERADVDHATVRIETVQAWKWARAVAEFAIVIVLDDPCARAASPLQEC